ncbi:hypothetical protein SVTN_14120 [Streptomyces vietnamensis]|uniref:Uncharacterized protein n=1 Tax=Streptomyces vietnamensis TaxID=362257 RepID=A0A0B5IAL9_9ACTN|nr:hypothetical protein SVTN_14120 [Streptomyces vietnamensis]
MAELYEFVRCPAASSGRELSSVQLAWSMASTDVERKQVTDDFGTTKEELREVHGLDVEQYGTADHGG